MVITYRNHLKCHWDTACFTHVSSFFPTKHSGPKPTKILTATVKPNLLRPTTSPERLEERWNHGNHGYLLSSENLLNLNGMEASIILWLYQKDFGNISQYIWCDLWMVEQSIASKPWNIGVLQQPQFIMNSQRNQDIYRWTSLPTNSELDCARCHQLSRLMLHRSQARLGTETWSQRRSDGLGTKRDVG